MDTKDFDIWVWLKINQSEGLAPQVLVPMFPLAARATHLGIPFFL